MNAQIEDAFNHLHAAMVDTIEEGITVGQARERAECILALLELRERLERELGATPDAIS